MNLETYHKIIKDQANLRIRTIPKTLDKETDQVWIKDKKKTNNNLLQSPVKPILKDIPAKLEDKTLRM